MLKRRRDGGGSSAPARRAPRVAGEHLVEFYDSDGDFVDATVRFLAPAWHRDEIAVLVATPEHRGAVADALAARGLDTTTVEHGGRLLLADAATTLDGLVVDGHVDRDRLRAGIGRRMLDAMAGGRGARVCGEMVVLLWERGDVTAAMALEDAWNEFRSATDVSLLCPYPTRVFRGDDPSDTFSRMCRQHSGVAPGGEDAAPTEPARLRAAASLQQELQAGSDEAVALRRQREELEDALTRLREVDRMRNDFVAMVVHDIRNPTATISAALDILRDGWREFDDDEIEVFLATAFENAQRIERLTGDMLTVAGLDAGDFAYDVRPVDLGEIVERTVTEVRRTTGRSVDVTVAPDLRPAFADEHRQTQILGNLLSNAVKFSPDHAPVRVEVADQGEHLVVRVRDEGRGIAADDLERLFQPFSRLTSRERRATKGTGLGLYIAKSLVEGQGGTIDVDSTVGVGSTFTYTVPTVEDASRRGDD